MILVTGGTGLLGSQLVFDLVSAGNAVRVFKRNSSDIFLLQKKFIGNESLFNNIEFVDGDVLDIFSIENALKGIKKVYHCAAFISFVPKHANQMLQINVQGTENMVNACLDAGVEKFCYVSSVAALGRNKTDDIITEDTLWEYDKHNSNYAISKYGAEREVWRGFTEGLNGVILNPSIILGEGDWKMDSSSIVGRVADGLKFYSDGVSGFVDARDVSKCMIALMDSKILNERFIISAENTSFKNVTTRIADELKLKPPSIYVSKTVLELGWWLEALRTFVTGKNSLITKETARSAVKKYSYSNEKVKKQLGFSFTPLDETVKDVCRKFLREKK